MAKVLDCSLEVNEFDLKSHYYIHFQINPLQKDMNPLIPPVMSQIVSMLFFNMDGFGIKYPMKIDMPLNKETKPNSLERPAI